jgi:cytochrome oxidase Cu insertion factor (SCO1/SenC/PrrC family)
MNNWRIWLISTLTLIAGLLVYLSLSSQDRTEAYEGTELSGEAPNFQLTDQNGSMISLSDFRGKVVVLTFMDSACKDTCPITAVHFREVYKQLDKNEADQVAFLGVNVNVEASAVTDVMETTRAWHLDEIPSWHFMTGSQASLEPVWKNYGVSATHSHEGNSIVHTPGTFLIDRLGQKRWYISTPFSNDGKDLTLPLSQLLLKHIHELLLVSNNGS